jgi:membrane fusion protein (multidrug efflux system)
VEVGNYVNPGQALLSIVQPGMWVTANFKETQLGQIRPGQKAKIHVDAFPDANLDGHVESLQAGTGSVFSALPAENATGNYVKIVQRLPVKIVFDGDAAQRLPLAPGMSVAPRVDVR